jgi:hypothetical protein
MITDFVSARMEIGGIELHIECISSLHASATSLSLNEKNDTFFKVRKGNSPEVVNDGLLLLLG